jgi:hypothetical protein
MLPRSCKAWSGRHGAYLEETLKQGWRCAKSWFVNACLLLNNPGYIFIVQRLSILYKLDSNNPYHIWPELYFLSLNYLIIQDTRPIQPSRRLHRSWFACQSYSSFGPILFAAHLLVQPNYGDNTWSVGLPWILGVKKWTTWPTLRRMYQFLLLTILFTRTSCTRNPIILYLCCMVARRSGYLTRAFDCTLVKVLHYGLIIWERRATPS